VSPGAARGVAGAAVLQRLPDLRLRLGSDGALSIETETGVVSCGSHGLAVLDAFTRPRPVVDVLAALKARVAGAHDWAELMGTISALHRQGILVSPGARTGLRGGAHGFDAARVHVGLLDDRSRTEAFLAGIRATVRPGDVVVDVGTGTGILAVAAAQAGAARVYAIEATGISSVARGVFQANGLQDRIVLVEGWSTRVKLPERADVLVSEIVGNDPFGESVLEYFADARRRLLQPRARVVPRRLRLYVTPVTVPPAARRAHTVTPDAVARWRRAYGVDLAPLLAAAKRTPDRLHVDPWRARAWPRLAAPVLVANVDLAGSLTAPRRVRRRLEVDQPGELGGLMLHFELETGGATITTDPRRVRRDNSWVSPVWLTARTPVRRGEVLVVSYQRGPDGGRAWCEPPGST
jgi:SAM-dependent methyltransferase